MIIKVLLDECLVYTKETEMWYPEGIPVNKQGTHTETTNWQIKDLDFIPKANTWYRMRIEVDFNNLEFVSFSISGDGQVIKEELTGEQLDYPNFIPFDEPSVTLSILFHCAQKSSHHIV